MIREWVFSGEFSSLQNYDWSLYQGGFDSLSLPPKLGEFMNIKNDMLGYPAVVSVVLITGLIGATINGLIGLILFFVLAIPLVFLVDSYLVEWLNIQLCSSKITYIFTYY